jgi:hypothetical protein
LSGSDTLAICHPVYQHFSSTENETNFQRFDSELRVNNSRFLAKTRGLMRCNFWKTSESEDIDGEKREGARKCGCEGIRRFRDKKLHRNVQKTYSEVGVLRNGHSMGLKLHEQFYQRSHGGVNLHLPWRI